MEGLRLWVLITLTLAGCAAALRISYNAALRRRPGTTSHVVARSMKLQLAMGLFLVLPFLLLTAIVPSVTLRSILNFTFCWVTPCKLLLLFHMNFSLDKPSAWNLSRFSHFLLSYLLPVRIKAIHAGLKLSFYDHLAPLFVKFSILLIHLSFYDSMPLSLSHVSHCVLMYLILDLPHHIASLVLLILFGIETHPTFKSPWFSSSLSDFWGRRWDLTANALLRHTVYNPIINIFTLPSVRVDTIKDMNDDDNAEIELKLLRFPLAISPATELESNKENGLTKKSLQRMVKGVKSASSISWSSMTELLCAPTKPPPLAVRLIGVNTTFFMSGLIHELLYFCVTQGELPTWEVTTFFVVQGIATSMEILTRRVGNRSTRMPRPLSVVFTVGFMFGSATWLFFPQLVRGGVYRKCAEEHKAVNEAIRKLVF